MPCQVGTVRDVVTGPLGRVERDRHVGRRVEREGESPVHGGQAVTRLEGPLHLDLERRLDTFGPCADPPQRRRHVEATDLRQPHRLAIDEPVPEPVVGQHGVHGGGHRHGVLGPQQHPGTPERLGHG